MFWTGAQTLFAMLRNILYLSTVPLGPDGCFITVASVLSVSLYLTTTVLLPTSQRGEGKAFLSPINNSALLIREIDFCVHTALTD